MSPRPSEASVCPRLTYQCDVLIDRQAPPSYHSRRQCCTVPGEAMAVTHCLGRGLHRYAGSQFASRLPMCQHHLISCFQHVTGKNSGYFVFWIEWILYTINKVPIEYWNVIIWHCYYSCWPYIVGPIRGQTINQKKKFRRFLKDFPDGWQDCS